MMKLLCQLSILRWHFRMAKFMKITCEVTDPPAVAPEAPTMCVQAI